MNKIITKKIMILDLLVVVDDDLIQRYFDIDSDKLLDEKIEVLKALKKGKQIKDIPNYYDILEKLPENGVWD